LPGRIPLKRKESKVKPIMKYPIKNTTMPKAAPTMANIIRFIADQKFLPDY